VTGVHRTKETGKISALPISSSASDATTGHGYENSISPCVSRFVRKGVYVVVVRGAFQMETLYVSQWFHEIFEFNIGVMNHSQPF
jgi:hypothetical protein